MKARVIKTGEMVDVYHEPQHGQITNICKESVLVNGRMWSEDELDFSVETSEAPEKISDFEMALTEMIGNAQQCVVEPIVVAQQWKDYLIELAKSEEPIGKQKLSNVERIGKNWKEEPVSEDLEKIVEEIAEPTILNAYGTKELARRLRYTIGISVSEDLEEAAYHNCIDRLSKESIEDFKAGARWQKQKTIDKACEYLDLHCNEVKTEDNGIAGWIDNEFINNFKQAMKDE